MAQNDKGSRKFCPTCGVWVRPTQPAGRCALCNRDLSKYAFKPLLTQQEELKDAERTGGDE